MKTFDFAILNQGYALHQSDWKFGPICSGFSRLYWVKEGEAEVKIAGKKYKLTPDHIYLIPSLVSHYDDCNGPFGHYYIHFLDQSKQIVEYYQQYDTPFQLDSELETEYGFKRLMKLFPDIKLKNPLPETYETHSSIVDCIHAFQSNPLGVRMEANGILLQLVSKFFAQGKRHHKVDDDRIQSILYQIERNLSSNFRIDILANDVRLGKDRFIRLFHHQTGYTPTEYIIRKRIQQAQMLFIDGNYSVKDVALSLGYDNVSYFGRLFKKITEMTPSEFIRQNK